MATNTNGKTPTTELIAAQALELADNMRALATQSVEEASRLNTYADSVANNIVEAVNRFTNQSNTLMTFIDRTNESCQVAIESINNVFPGAAKAESKLPPASMKALERVVSSEPRR